MPDTSTDIAQLIVEHTQKALASGKPVDFRKHLREIAQLARNGVKKSLQEDAQKRVTSDNS